MKARDMSTIITNLILLHLWVYYYFSWPLDSWICGFCYLVLIPGDFTVCIFWAQKLLTVFWYSLIETSKNVWVKWVLWGVLCLRRIILPSYGGFLILFYDWYYPNPNTCMLGYLYELTGLVWFWSQDICHHQLHSLVIGLCL